MSDDGERARPLFGFDPDEAARLVAEVQELGFNAARMVVDRFAEMFDRYRAQAAGDTTNGGERVAETEPGVRFHVDSVDGQRIDRLTVTFQPWHSREQPQVNEEDDE